MVQLKLNFCQKPIYKTTIKIPSMSVIKDLSTTTEKYDSLQTLSKLDETTLATLASIKASDLKKLGVAVDADPKIISKALVFLSAKKIFS